MQGGRKGLIVNSTDLCKGRHRAVAEFRAHNGRVKDFRPLVRPVGCKRQRNGKGGRRIALSSARGLR